MPDRARPGKTAKTARTGKTRGQRQQNECARKARLPAPVADPAVPVTAPPDWRPARSGARVDVRKTYKLFIGGAFPRSESGRSYPAAGPDGAVLAHVAQASRKDARDAVVAARKATAGWAGATAYNRGQVLYRVAELLQGRAAQFTAESVANEGVSRAEAERAVTEAIDRWVWYAGLARQGRPGDGGRQPGGGAVLQLQRARADRGGGRARARRARPARAGQRARAGDRHRQHRGGGGQRVRAAAGRHPGRGARDLGRAARGGEHPDRPHRRTRAGARRAHGRERDRPHRGGRGRPGRAGAARGRERQARVRLGRRLGGAAAAGHGCWRSWRSRRSGTRSAFRARPRPPAGAVSRSRRTCPGRARCARSCSAR